MKKQREHWLVGSQDSKPRVSGSKPNTANPHSSVVQSRGSENGYTHTHVFTRTYVIHTYTHTYTYVHTHTIHTCTHRHSNRHTYTCTHAHMCACTHRYTYEHVLTHVHTHTHGISPDFVPGSKALSENIHRTASFAHSGASPARFRPAGSDGNPRPRSQAESAREEPVCERKVGRCRFPAPSQRARATPWLFVHRS